MDELYRVVQTVGQGHWQLQVNPRGKVQGATKVTKPVKLPKTASAAAKQYWLMKSEPSECSIDDLVAAPSQTVPWVGVRNYQARNFMRDSMQIGDGVLFYHSSCPLPGVAGLAEVASHAYPDATQFDKSSPYYDVKASKDAPRWLHVDVRLRNKTTVLSLAQMRADKSLETMVVLKAGNRLSVTPVTPAQWQAVLQLLFVSE